MISADFYLLTVSKICKLPLSLRRDITFYAPFTDSLDYQMGVGTAAFVRAGTASAVYRGGTFTLAANVPRFEYSGETQLGLLINSGAGETLTFATANNLNSGNHLFWVEEGVLKRAPSDTNPVNGSGLWTGTNNKHVRDLLKFNRVLTSDEITKVNNIIYSGFGAGPSVPASGTWVIEDLIGSKDGVNKNFSLTTIPVTDSLMIVLNGAHVTKTTNPAPVAGFFYNSGSITLGVAPDIGDSLWAQYQAA